jgi:hypothetical protein
MDYMHMIITLYILKWLKAFLVKRLLRTMVSEVPRVPSKDARLRELLEGKVGLEAQVRALPTTKSLEAALGGQRNQLILAVQQERYGTDGCFSSSFLYPHAMRVGVITEERVNVHHQADQFSPQGHIILAEVPTLGYLYAPNPLLGSSVSSWKHEDSSLPFAFDDLFDPSGDTPHSLYPEPTVALEKGTAVYIGKDVDRFLEHRNIGWTSRTIRPLLLFQPV